MRHHPVLSTALLAATVLTVPAATAQTEPRNKIEFSNWWITDREDTFPNFRSPGGNVAGDGLFKILPGSLLDRDGDHVVTGYRMAISVDDAFTGQFPVFLQLPSIQLYRTKFETIGGTTYETVDLSQPIGPPSDPVLRLFSSDATWVVESAIPPITVPALVGGRRAGLAIMALAEEGQASSASIPGVVMQSSFQERHLAPGQPSYSGSYDAATGQVAMFGLPGQPSATGELYLAARFRDPTLQLSGETAGGIAADPLGFETYLGPGAYHTDLATRGGGWFGIYVQAEQFDPAGGAPTHLAFPLLVSTSVAGPTMAFPLTTSVALRINPAELAAASLLIQAGMAGPIDTYLAGGVAGFDEDQAGVYASPHRNLPARASWSGAELWLQALIVDNALQPAGVTNAVRWTLR